MAKVVIRPVGGQKGIAYITTEAGGGQAPSFTLPDGSVITGVKASSIGRQWAEPTPAGTQYQWVFPNFNAYGQPITVNQGDQSKQLTFTPDTEYRTESGGLAGVDQAPNKAGGGGATGGFTPGQIGQYGYYPAYQNFPGVTLGQYNPIKAAPYQFTDPIKFGKKYAEFARSEQVKNFDLSKDLALETLGTELKSLFSFAPAAAALKRSETSADNIFNQQQRTNQVNTALPGVGQDLADQAGRARAYASGSLPNAQLDKAFELGIRSNAADVASSGGFGGGSSAARKISDLMSADSRFKIAQYGENLLTGNIEEKAKLFLAPTEYSNAGSQINVNPSVSAGQLIPGFTNQINGYAAIPASTALGSETQQQQFSTNLEQGTRQFNAANQLQLSEFNASATNQFALQEFGYNVGYAGAVAGAAQTNTNTEVALQQQQQYQQIVQQLMQQQQQTQQIGSIVSSILGLLGQGTGTSQGSIFSQITNWASSLFGSDASSGYGSATGTGATDIGSLFGVNGAGGTTSTNPFYAVGGSVIGAALGVDPQTGAVIGSTLGPTIESTIRDFGSSVGHALGF